MTSPCAAADERRTRSPAALGTSLQKKSSTRRCVQGLFSPSLSVGAALGDANAKVQARAMTCLSEELLGARSALTPEAVAWHVSHAFLAVDRIQDVRQWILLPDQRDTAAPGDSESSAAT